MARMTPGSGDQFGSAADRLVDLVLTVGALVVPGTLPVLLPEVLTDVGAAASGYATATLPVVKVTFPAKASWVIASPQHASNPFSHARVHLDMVFPLSILILNELKI